MGRAKNVGASEKKKKASDFSLAPLCESLELATNTPLPKPTVATRPRLMDPSSSVFVPKGEPFSRAPATATWSCPPLRNNGLNFGRQKKKKNIGSKEWILYFGVGTYNVRCFDWFKKGFKKEKTKGKALHKPDVCEAKYA